MPSKILRRIPGPRVAQRGAPVPSTGSPGRRPVVTSYTCIVVTSLEMEMTSPINFFAPTYTISIMEKPEAFRTVTTGPLIE